MTQVTTENLIKQAKNGKIVSFPTDTVPALAILPENAGFIFDLKGRSDDKPLILMGGSLQDLWEYVRGSESERAVWQEVAGKYLPGALTLVLPAGDRIPQAMNPKNPSSIGIRVPRHSLACEILTKTGPLATTSANKSGFPALLTMREIEEQFPQVYTLRLHDQEVVESQLGLPSTVVRWTGKGWEILRQGAVIFEF
jgi:L-threonylcarbamoyladenylate synthase